MPKGTTYSEHPTHIPNLLLCDVANIPNGSTVLDVEPGSDVFCNLASKSAGAVTVLSTSWAESHSISRSLDSSATSVSPAHGPGALQSRFDVVVIRAHRVRLLTQRWIVEGWTKLLPGGSLYLAGHKNSGIKPAIRFLTEKCENVRTIAIKKRCRVAVAIKSDIKSDKEEGSELQTTDPFVKVYYGTDERPYPVWTTAGVFSWERLDEGTSELIAALDIRRGEKLLDLGCGNGVVGVAGAETTGWGNVELMDDSWLAVECARRTVLENGGDVDSVTWSDVGRFDSGTRYDVIATNPPFHTGRHIDLGLARRFVSESARLLNPGGRLYLVASRSVSYREAMGNTFSQVTTLRQNSRYTVYMGTQVLTG